MTSKAKRTIIVLAGIALLAVAAYLVMRQGGEWKGVDDNVVNKIAEEHGRPAQKPLIDTDQGDFLLFVFTIAGAVGGFVLGYYFRALFGTKEQGQENAPDA